jgi:glycosyltransferase involved in cell wall biosynthesis
MKIAFIATEIGLQEGGAYMGGTVNNIVTIGRELSERGHDISLITTTPRDAAEKPMAELDWATVYEYDPPFDHGTPWYFASFCLFAARTSRQLAQSGELDTATIHAGYPQWGVIGRLASAVTDCRIIHVQYCPLNQKSGKKLYDVTKHPWFVRRYLGSADGLVGISENVSNTLNEVCDRSDSHVILPAIDTERYAPKAASVSRESEKYISYLGSLNPQKGLDILIDAFDEIRDTHDYKLKLGLEVRSERSDSELANRIRQDPDIEVNGIVDNVPAFLAGSDLFAIPFRTTMGPADYPVAALEAMSCGTPILATDVGGLRQLVNNSSGGYCVGDPTVANFESGLQTLLKDVQRREEMADNAREFIIDSCSVSRVTDQFESVLRPELSSS